LIQRIHAGGMRLASLLPLGVTPLVMRDSLHAEHCLQGRISAGECVQQFARHEHIWR